MAQAEIRETLSVDRDKLFQAVTRYEDYPKFVDGVHRVEVDRKSPTQARVKYHLNLIKEISYTLDHTENPETGEVSWTLVESDFIKRNVGGWKIEAAGAGKTKVHYQVEIDFKIPVPGLILNRLVKGSLPTMIKNFEKQAQKG